MPKDQFDLITRYFPELSKEQLDRIHKAIHEYVKWNELVNVVSRKDVDFIVERHFLHSLSIALFIKFTDGSKILDLGTGGGFPGIPLAIYFPKVQFTLCDSIGKKIKVIDAITDSIGLNNVNTVNSRVEELDQKFDFVVSRAVAPIRTIRFWTENLISKTNRNHIHNGYLFLKGGDLKNEIKEGGLRCKEIDLSIYFKEEFFQTKKLVYASSGKN